MRRLFIDTTVLVHAIGVEHPLRAPSRGVLALGADSVQLCASVEAIQELLHHRMRRVSRAAALSDAGDAAASVQLFPFDQAVLARALAIVGQSRVRGRDAVHAATALEHGFASIVTGDNDFEGIPGLAVVTPQQALASMG